MESAVFDPDAYWESRLAADPNLKGVGFAGLSESFNEWMYRVRKPVFTGAVRKSGLKPAEANVLDIGCGTGFYINLWTGMGAKSVKGVDITQTSVDLLSSKFPQATFAKGDAGDVDGLRKAGIEDGSLDAISTMDVLFHIVDDSRFQEALNNIGRALKPGGVFFVSDNFVHGEAIRLEHHVSRSLAEYTSALDAAGFVIERRAPMFYLMNAPVDRANQKVQARWIDVMHKIARTEKRGRISGALMYPLERYLVRVLKESPSTEMMVCRKR